MSRKKLDKIVVVDVEATCWQGDPPPGQKHEIIEVGICLLRICAEGAGKRTDRESLLVRPECSEVSKFCTELTTLTQEQVAQGMEFAEACRILTTKYQSDRRLWASYGDYDRAMFERQCRERSLPYPFGRGHINVKSLLAVTCGLRREWGMARALKHLGLPLEGTHHRGGDDAWNIAAILSKILCAARSGLLV